MTTPLPGEPDAAQRRVLNAATAAFVEHGFKSATVRKICDQAQVNVAMVNYYYHSKEALYLAVLRAAIEQDARELRAEPVAATPALQLEAAIHRLTGKLLTPGSESPLYKLIAWELMEPSAATPTLVEGHIVPQHAHFAAIVDALTHGRLAPEQVQSAVLSILGQVVFYAHSRRIHELSNPRVTYDADGIQRIARHIADFSLAALLHLAPTPTLP